MKLIKDVSKTSITLNSSSRPKNQFAHRSDIFRLTQKNTLETIWVNLIDY